MEKKSLILIVDDEAYFREIFSKKLMAEGFDIGTAENGKDAIEKAKQLKPDLVLMDVKMAEMDGVEALMKIKEGQETKNMKVAFLTSFGNPEEDVHNLSPRYSKEMGAVGYIRKTDDLDSLVSKVKELV
ncbi:MAG TPA: response regulator [Candidatus Paceibacterota bacterium]|nr:response regulator [Candidatus Paceibacterota bacterium]